MYAIEGNWYKNVCLSLKLFSVELVDRCQVSPGLPSVDWSEVDDEWMGELFCACANCIKMASYNEPSHQICQE